jgi:hypothetical protein
MVSATASTPWGCPSQPTATTVCPAACAAWTASRAPGSGCAHSPAAQPGRPTDHLAGADEDLIPRWAEIGRERAELAGRPPFSRPGRIPRRP